MDGNRQRGDERKNQVRLSEVNAEWAEVGRLGWRSGGK